MRGIGSTLSRLPAARAFLAGAAFLASTAVRPGMSQAAPMEASGPDETALAVPRVHLPGALPGGPSGVGLPQPLAPSEAARLRRIFALQRAGDMPAAIAATAELTDDTLLGHLLADRFIAAPARATAPELAAWLGRYADLPDAPTVYRLLPAPNTRPAAFLPAIPAPAAAEPSLPPRQPGLDAAVLAAARAGHADAALHLVARARIPSLYGAMLRGEVATALLEQGRDREALSTGRDGWQHADGALGQPAYVAALAAWRAGEPDAAGRLFQAASTAPLATPDARAAAAFWAARVRGRADDPAGSRAWLLRAAAAAPAASTGPPRRPARPTTPCMPRPTKRYPARPTKRYPARPTKRHPARPTKRCPARPTKRCPARQTSTPSPPCPPAAAPSPCCRSANPTAPAPSSACSGRRSRPTRRCAAPYCSACAPPPCRTSPSSSPACCPAVRRPPPTARPPSPRAAASPSTRRWSTASPASKVTSTPPPSPAPAPTA